MKQVPDSWVKIRLQGPDGDVETPWAEQLGPRRFRLDNLPWFAYGVSDDDIVEAEPTEDEGFFEFVRVLEPGGNRLVRVIFDDPAESKAVCEGLLSLGCHYEGANPKYVSVSIPPSLPLERVTDFLTLNEQTWEHANPTYEQLHPDN